MGLKKQYYGIKFPFTDNNNDGIFIDLNTDGDEKVASQIAHIILTPKRTRVRMPDFGTDLIKYIFSPNDELEWSEVKEEISNAIKKYLNDITINDVNVIMDENNDNGIYVSIDYSTQRGNLIEKNKMMIKI